MNLYNSHQYLCAVCKINNTTLVNINLVHEFHMHVDCSSEFDICVPLTVWESMSRTRPLQTYTSIQMFYLNDESLILKTSL